MVITENDKGALTSEFRGFIGKHDWSDKTKIACTYTFFHTLNAVNSHKENKFNIGIHDNDEEMYKAKSEYYESKAQELQCVIDTVKNQIEFCEDAGDAILYLAELFDICLKAQS